MILIDNDFKGEVCIPINCVTAVYLGARMDSLQKIHIKEIADRKSIPVYELKLSADSFELIF